MLQSNCCDDKLVLIFACSGGSNVGQITNDAAKKLTEEGLGRFFCLAGVGGDIKGIIDTTKGADAVVVLDGCSVGCAKAIVEKVEVPIALYVDATELGIDKNPSFDYTNEQVEMVCAAVRDGLTQA